MHLNITYVSLFVTEIDFTTCASDAEFIVCVQKRNPRDSSAALRCGRTWLLGTFAHSQIENRPDDGNLHKMATVRTKTPDKRSNSTRQSTRIRSQQRPFPQHQQNNQRPHHLLITSGRQPGWELWPFSRKIVYIRRFVVLRVNNVRFRVCSCECASSVNVGVNCTTAKSIFLDTLCKL